MYWHEPIAPDDPLLALPNVIATPHIAGVADRSYEKIADQLPRISNGCDGASHRSTAWPE